MHTDGGDTERDAQALQGALDEATAGFPDGDRGAALESAGRHWLRVGLKLGLERPEQARRLLDMIGGQDAERAAQPHDAAGDVPAAGTLATQEPLLTTIVPVRSLMLARSATMPPSERAEAGPEVMFGWATRLTPGEILAVGRVAVEMLAAGAPPDTGRGFGVAWDAGIRIPRKDRDTMFREFSELEVSVGSVLAGRDLRAEEPAPLSSGLGGLFSQLLPPKSRGVSRAGEAIERSGEPGRRGLVALWNAWVAVRYRALIPSPTFELLVRPWVTVVGTLPEP